MPAKPANFVLVDFEPADQAAVRQLVLDGLAEHWGPPDEPLNGDLDDIASFYGSGRTVVGRDGDAIIATGTVIPWDETTAEIVRMSVHRNHRHLGLGRLVVTELLATAKRWHIQRVVLETSSAWHGVVRFYLSCGFRVSHRVEGDFGEDTRFELNIQ